MFCLGQFFPCFCSKYYFPIILLVTKFFLFLFLFFTPEPEVNSNNIFFLRPSLANWLWSKCLVNDAWSLSSRSILILRSQMHAPAMFRAFNIYFYCISWITEHSKCSKYTHSTTCMKWQKLKPAAYYYLIHGKNTLHRERPHNPGTDSEHACCCFSPWICLWGFGCFPMVVLLFCWILATLQIALLPHIDSTICIYG